MLPAIIVAVNCHVFQDLREGRLRLPGEEKFLGRYATILEGEFDSASPLAGVRRILSTTGGLGHRLGARCLIGETMRRLRENARARKNSTP